MSWKISTSITSIMGLKLANVFHLYKTGDPMLFNNYGPVPTLVQMVARCLEAPSHYLNQCWLITSKVQWYPLENFKFIYLNSIEISQGANELTRISASSVQNDTTMQYVKTKMGNLLWDPPIVHFGLKSFGLGSDFIEVIISRICNPGEVPYHRNW